MMKISLGADHGAYELKEAIKKHLDEKGIMYKDYGCFSKDSVDYPKYAYIAANAVAKGDCDYGIICCTTGLGVSMAANKVKGIRAAVCTNEMLAEMTRRHNNANVICMGQNVVSEDLAMKMIDIFLSTEFEGGRHNRRVNLLTDIEDGKELTV